MIVRPLEGLKVLDFTRLLPGPYATLVMADLGAQVDKVEEPLGGDYVRQMPPFVGDMSALFATLNRGKRSLAVDLKAGGAKIIRQLVKQYDVIFESFRPGVMDKLGVGYEALAKENPRIVYCALSGYGQNGPDRTKAGHDINYIARAGVLAYGGPKHGAPVLPGVQVADTGGGLFSLVGILAALYARERTGQGRFVDVSMTESAMAFLHLGLGARRLMGKEGLPLQRGAELLNGGVPCYGVYRTFDGQYLAVGALEPKFFEALCEALGRVDLVDGAYDTGERGQAVRRELERIFSSQTAQHWLNTFAGCEVCVELVAEGDVVFDDPQHAERRVFDAVPGSTALRTPLVSTLPQSAAWPPELGQHTDEILAQAGFSSTQIADWARAGIVKSRAAEASR
ncbi:MAG: CoA transferase [Myxococcaceae bacterium]|nr:CoA transferase [Myxococcaceae bacterium]